ncbi:phage major capsid protein [Anaerosinus massiliensis]|uniref:phage major capsid protein n=1 Tax=Massilibacillus massiliensis TaxID=1806837 RepID=UPI000A8094D1|nr:phage major capsid protein [Massilibacillus massiliensis]
MNKEKYLAKRNELLIQAENFINEGKIKEAQEIRNQIEKLDTDFEDAAKEMANLSALQKGTVVLNLVNKSVKPNGMQTVDQIGFNGQNQNKEEFTAEEKKLYKNAFAKHLMGVSQDKDESEMFSRMNTKFSNAVQTEAAHTVLVPETVRDQIWQEIGEAHPILNDLAMTFVPGDLTLIKEENSLSNADGSNEEDEAGDDDELDFGELNLTGCELSKAITISWKLKKMSMDAFLTYITKKIAEKMGNGLAKWVVEGKGKPGTNDTWKPQARGIAVALEAETSTPQVISYSDSDPIVYKKLTAALAKMKSGYLSGAAIYAQNDMIWNVLANIVDGVGRPIFVPDANAGGVGRILGLPVKEEDAVSKGEIVIGNVGKGYAINANENITMYQEDHVKPRKTDYMGYAIIDGDVLTTKAFVLIKKN